MESIKKITFYNEISLMMFGFGDSHKPSPDTVRLVESIVLQQMRSIVQEAQKHSRDGTGHLHGEELVFLMRHNKQKMQRFVRYLRNKMVKSMVQAMQSSRGLEENAAAPKQDALLNFIELIDETGEFTELSEVDEVKRERDLRADRISQALDEKQYLEFAKARCVSFNSRGTIQQDVEKLRQWIDPRKRIIFDAAALDTLAYFAYQTVAELIDMALLVRADSKCGTDPLDHLKGSYYTSAMFKGSHRFNDANLDYSRVHSGEAAISVNEIREVMRRVHLPKPGKLNFGGKVPETHFLLAL